MCHSLLKDGGQVIVSPWNYSTLEKVYQKCSINVVPVVIYAISREQFTEKVRVFLYLHGPLLF